jgi:UDP-N-acetyl-D-mannosaminuronic acid dehydrogenase
MYQIFCRRAGPFPTRIQDVGVVIDLAPHDVDIMRFLAGTDPTRVYSEIEKRIHTDHEDLLWASLRFPDGVIGGLEINWLTPTKIREVLVLGERGMFRADALTQDLYFYENSLVNDVQWATLQTIKGVSEGSMTRYAIPRFEPLKAELQSFLKALQDVQPVPISGEDGLAALKISLALVESGQTLNELYAKIENKAARLVVIGQGYVGLPVAAMFADKGFDVLGVDIRADLVEKINAGVNPIEGREPGLAELLTEVISSSRLRATTDYNELGDRDIVIIAVETPVDDNHAPRYEALRAVLTGLAPVMKTGALVIIESTIAPRTMHDLVLPLLEEKSGKKLNEGFYLGNCPERVMPGKLLKNLRTMNRVIGGMTPETSKAMIALYENIVEADLDPADCITAELVKTVENAYRDVQIAFANEVALVAEAAGGDVWKVRELVNKSPMRQMHLPGAGVGGHCIPKDPWLLVHGAGERGVTLRLIPAAREINNAMPLHMVKLLEGALTKVGRSILDARVAVLGYAYLEDSDDTRNSPTRSLVARLYELGAEPVIHDPWMTEYNGDVYEKIKGCDAAVVMVAHSAYKGLDLRKLKSALRLPILIDGRRVFNLGDVKSTGLSYTAIGVSA